MPYDRNNVIDTSWQEGRAEGQRSLILRLLTRQWGDLPDDLRSPITDLPLEALESLSDGLFDFSGLDDIRQWLVNQQRLA